MEAVGLLLLRGSFVSDWSVDGSCLAVMCFCRPVAVLYFLSQRLHSRPSQVGFTIALLV